MSRIITADAIEGLKTLPNNSVDCMVTSTPYYGLRDYGVDEQIGLEATPEEYIAKLVAIFKESWRVLRDDGTLWINIADSYAGSRKGAEKCPKNVKYSKRSTNHGMIGQIKTTRVGWGNCKPKDLIGIPWMLAFALRNDGWYLRQDIIWEKPNAMPESVKDRCTKSHEYIFLFSKSRRYYFDYEAIQEPCLGLNQESIAGSVGAFGQEQSRRRKKVDAPHEDITGLRRKRDVWHIATTGCTEGHFATFPPKLIRPCILAGCPIGGVVLDMFGGSGTTGLVAAQEGREYILIDINPAYSEIARRRVAV